MLIKTHQTPLFKQKNIFHIHFSSVFFGKIPDVKTRIDRSHRKSISTANNILTTIQESKFLHVGKNYHNHFTSQASLPASSFLGYY